MRARAPMTRALMLHALAAVLGVVVLAALVSCAGMVASGGSEAHAAAHPAAGRPESRRGDRAVWEVYALRYATVPAFPLHELVAGADTTRTVDIAMMFWLLKGPAGRRVLVDAGFYRQKFLDSWKLADFIRPSDAVRHFGLEPDSITDIIVSHVHWDHLDGVDLFPNARIWIQRAEFEHYVGQDGMPLDAAIDTLDAAMLAGLDKAGRVKRVNGDSREILPGIIAYTGGKHTFESQYVGVHTAQGTVVVASDNAYLYENLDRHKAIAQTLDAKSNLKAQERMMKLASAWRLVVPGHDPAVFDHFKKAGPGAVKIE